MSGPEVGPEQISERPGEREPVVVSPRSPSPFVLFGLGGANAACWLVGFAVGWLIDDHVGTTPLFTILGLLVGVTLGAMSTYKEVRRYLRQ